MLKCRLSQSQAQTIKYIHTNKVHNNPPPTPPSSVYESMISYISTELKQYSVNCTLLHTALILYQDAAPSEHGASVFLQHGRKHIF